MRNEVPSKWWFDSLARFEKFSDEEYASIMAERFGSSKTPRVQVDEVASHGNASDDDRCISVSTGSSMPEDSDEDVDVDFNKINRDPDDGSNSDEDVDVDPSTIEMIIPLRVRDRTIPDIGLEP